MSEIPERERGYAVELHTSTVHERHPSHAIGFAIRTTRRGMLGATKGEPVPCRICFPAPRPRRRPEPEPVVVAPAPEALDS